MKNKNNKKLDQAVRDIGWSFMVFFTLVVIMTVIFWVAKVD